MIESLISSKTRIKLLLKFFLNSNTTSYLRGLETEFGDSTNGIRLELNKLERAGMLRSFSKGNRKYFQANTTHPLFQEVHKIILKHVGIDQLVETVTNRLGDLERVYLVGSFSKGMDSNIIDIVVVGDIDKSYLIKLIEKAEGVINRKIRYLIFSPNEFGAEQKTEFDPKPLLLWAR